MSSVAAARASSSCCWASAVTYAIDRRLVPEALPGERRRRHRLAEAGADRVLRAHDHDDAAADGEARRRGERHAFRAVVVARVRAWSADGPLEREGHRLGAGPGAGRGGER